MPRVPHTGTVGAMDAQLLTMDREECLSLLAGEQVGRIVHGHGPLPTILPVTYVLDAETIVFRTVAASRLVATAGSLVAFEVDEMEPALHAGWSVVVQGRLERVTDAQEVQRLSALVEAWAPGERDALLRIHPSLVNGRRIVPGTGGATRA